MQQPHGAIRTAGGYGPPPGGGFGGPPPGGFGGPPAGGFGAPPGGGAPPPAGFGPTYPPAPGAYPNQPKRKVLYDAAIAACDNLDGVNDGLISNVAACNASFDPSTAMLNGQPVRCANGADTGDTCLSDAQINALQVYNSQIVFGYALGSGETQYPGFNVWGADLGMSGNASVQPTVIALALNLELAPRQNVR